MRSFGLQTPEIQFRERTSPQTVYWQLTGGTNIGNMIAGGGLASAFDGTLVTAQASCCQKAVSTSGYNNTVGKQWDKPTVLNHVILYGPSNTGVLGGASTTFNIDGSDDNFTGTTTLASGIIISLATNTVLGVANLSSTPFLYHRINFNGDGAATIAISEVLLYGYTV